MKHKRSTNAIVALAKKKREETLQKVEKAIRQLIKENRCINFNSVSDFAGVSKSYLYNHTPFVKELKHFDNNSEKLYLQNSENGKWGMKIKMQ
ncbi:DUF6262 family protein [Bacillus paranthracis]